MVMIISASLYLITRQKRCVPVGKKRVMLWSHSLDTWQERVNWRATSRIGTILLVSFPQVHLGVGGLLTKGEFWEQMERVAWACGGASFFASRDLFQNLLGEQWQLNDASGTVHAASGRIRRHPKV